jgi:putative RNA 2'-phosphotransferase
MEKDKSASISKFLSYVLRHHPEDIHLEMDKEGWVNLNHLVENIAKHSEREISKEDILYVVETNAKKRFDLTENKEKIRANQGHSVEVYLELPAIKPPEFLYHGTATRFLESIQEQGLKPMQRHDVHLSFDIKTAIAVGQRHGKPVVLRIKALEMFEAGFEFKCTKNNVWLTQSVPSKYFEIV